MEHSTWLVQPLIFLAAAVVLLPLLRYLKMTSILGFLVVGVLLGPHGLGLIGKSADIQHLAELGVVFLLFSIGLELSLERLRLLGNYVFGLGGLQVCITAFVLDALFYWSGIPLQAALVLGGALALSSTAFVTEMLLQRNELMATYGRIAFAVLLLQDIAVIPMLVFQDLLQESSLNIAQTFLTAAISGVTAIAVVIVIGRFVLRPVFHWIARSGDSNLFVAFTLLVILGSSWILLQGGLSMAMGAFLCGVLLAESEFRHQIEADIRPFKGLLLGLFFATVGMSLDLGLILQQWSTIALMMVLLILIKTCLLTALTRLFNVPWRISLRVGLLLGSGGEFAFVILGSAQSLGLMQAQTAQAAMAVVGLSMILTPLLSWIGSRLAIDPAAGDLNPTETWPEDSDFVLIAGFGRVGQTVAKSLAAVGVGFIAVDKDPARVLECRKSGIAVYFGDAAKSGVLEQAGAQFARAVVLALDTEDDANTAIIGLHHAAIDTPIIARSQDLQHRRALEEKGAYAVIPDTVEASLRLGEVVLETLDISEDEAREALNRLRANDYALLELPMERSN